MGSAVFPQGKINDVVFLGAGLKQANVGVGISMLTDRRNVRSRRKLCWLMGLLPVPFLPGRTDIFGMAACDNSGR